MSEQKTNEQLLDRIAELESWLETVIDAGEDMRHVRPNSVQIWIKTMNRAVVVAGGKVSKGAREE